METIRYEVNYLDADSGIVDTEIVECSSLRHLLQILSEREQMSDPEIVSLAFELLDQEERRR